MNFQGSVKAQGNSSKVLVIRVEEIEQLMKER